MRRSLASFALLSLLVLPGYAAKPAHLLKDLARTQLIVDTSSIHCVLFDIYIAEDGKQRSQGLMYVESMNIYEGMLFVYPQTTRIRMWMKNTLIPLDMLFIDADMTVAHIHREAVPLSEDIIEPPGPVAGVIELNGGASDRFGIRKGDRVILPGT